LPPEPTAHPTLEDIETAALRIGSMVSRTPLVESPVLSGGGSEVLLKLETVHPTGSFKIRGAASRILALDEVARQRGVVTASTGNHGRAVAHVARRLGVPATVCVSEGVPAGKVAALESMGCELVLAGASQSEALVNARRLATDEGMTLVHPFDDFHVIAGQGTIGLELVEASPRVRNVLVPLSGGGLAAGVAIAVKSHDPTIRVIGVSMKRAPVMAASLDRGEPVELAEKPTLADSLQGGIGLDNRHTFHIVRDLLDDVVLVDEPDIWAGMRFALQDHRLVLEGGAAVGIGALLAGYVEVRGRTVVVCTGSNIEAHHLAELAGELVLDVRPGRSPLDTTGKGDARSR
jgi:threonine dehydratase